MCGCLRGFQKRRTRATYGHDAGQKTIHKKGWIGVEKKRRHDRGRNTRKIEGTDDTTGKKGIFLKNK